MKEKRENEENNSSNEYNNSDTEIQESLLNYPSLETNPTHTYNTETEPKKVQTKHSELKCQILFGNCSWGYSTLF